MANMSYAPTNIDTPSNPNAGAPAMSYVNAAPAPTATPSAPAAPASPGSYKGIVITPGSDASVAAQIAAIDAKQAKPQIVSSNSAIDSNSTKSAMNAAGNALTGPSPNTTNNNSNTNTPTDNSGIDPTTGAAIDALSAANKVTQGLFQNMQNALQMQYNADLAKNNAQYDALFQNLAQQHTAALGVAAQNAATLNPYSTTKGATTDVNFAGAINDKYQQQAAQLNEQAQAAQQELAAGNYSNYVQLQGRMQDSQNTFNNNMTSILQNYQSQQIAKAKAAQDLAEFNQGESDKAVTQYTDSLSKLQLPTPDELKGMTDAQLMALPAVQQGLAAGYTLDGIKTDLSNAANLQSQNSQYKSAQIAAEQATAANTERLANEGSKVSAADKKQNSLASISEQLVPGSTISASDDTPVLDSSGYITPQAWKTLEENAPGMGLSRDDLLSEFGYKLYVGSDGSPSKAYGVSPEEAKKYISGATSGG